MGSETKAHLPSPHGAQEGIQNVNFNNKQQVKMGFPRNEKDEAGAGGLKGPHCLPPRPGNKEAVDPIEEDWHQAPHKSICLGS